ncbi:MAG: SDR family NAD(P)-dependent oxidoreductase [Gammaproteobacteria bacterium]|jgi:NAD(P)-dependent dehydrogenase (short-subunit alcohol dehydrogenase family)|nr:SDR family NAD(P)-dependent oxidoreductase [Gammaproteobacteria bacterium]
MNIVITGGTRGIGRGMALELVRRGHQVTISGRTAEATQAAADELNNIGPGTALGVVADCRRAPALQTLWEAASDRFGSIDIWVNNAGVTNRKLPLAQLTEDEIVKVFETNLIGVAAGCRVAIAGMLEQGHGKIFNMEGFGSDGMMQPGMTLYGASKRALRYMTESLAKEYADTPLIIANMSPGVVVTEFLTRDLYAHDPAELDKRRKFLNLIADRVETVAPALVDGMLKLERTGGAVRWMTPMQALGRLALSPFRKRDPFTNPATTE